MPWFKKSLCFKNSNVLASEKDNVLASRKADVLALRKQNSLVIQKQNILVVQQQRNVKSPHSMARKDHSALEQSLGHGNANILVSRVKLTFGQDYFPLPRHMKQVIVQGQHFSNIYNQWVHMSPCFEKYRS